MNMKCGSLCAMLGVATHALAGGSPAEVDTPVLRVPQLDKPPTMDGKVGADEYARALTFTGIVGNPLGKPFLLPAAQQVTWLLGFHGDMLYIAMRSPHPKGTYPTGRVKDDDNPDVLWCDHTEIQILTGKREDAARPGKGFFKIMTNAMGARHDAHLWNGTPGTEDLWSSGGEYKAHVTDSCWEMELSIKAEAVGLKQWDGSTFVLQLVRADDPIGVYFGGLCEGPWMNWKQFAEVTCDAAAPAFHLESLGEPMAGAVDVKLSAFGTGQAPQEVAVEVSAADAGGKSLCQDKVKLDAKPGVMASAQIAKSGLAVSDVTIDEGRNWIEVKAVWVDGKTSKTLFHNRMAFMKMSPEWRAKYLDPWLAGRPQGGQWDAGFAHLPYAKMALAKVDVDFFGVPEEARKAQAFTVSVRAKGKKESLASAKGAVAKGAGEALFAVPELADGEYEAVFALDSGPTQTVAFQRKRYPFERNRLGMSNEVIPPYTPIAVNPERLALPGGRSGLPKPEGDLVVVWGRGYEFGPNGLPGRIHAVPPTGAAGGIEQILAAPLRFEAAAGGKPLAVEGRGARVASAQPHEAVIEGQSAAPGLALKTSTRVEYDGWCEVTLTLEPAAETTLDALDFVADIRDSTGDARRPPFAADTLYVQRMGAGIDNSFHGAIPAKPGVCFKSETLWPIARTGPADVKRDWKSFVPVCYFGGADRGLWFFAWSDKGWTLKDKQSALTVERLPDGTARLRVRLIAGPEKIDKPRKLCFAVQASPIKPNDPEYRTRLGSIAHDTSGYRYYGDSVDSYALGIDEEYAALRQYLMYGTALQKDPDAKYSHWQGRLGKMIREGRADRVMLYGSQWMTGAGSEEFDSFGGEWLGSNNWKPVPDVKFNGASNYGGTTRWKTPRQMSALRVNWPQSMLDFFVWYHDRLIDKAGINGTWWDNCYAGVVTEYDPELGRLESVWNLYPRRQLCKRLNVIGWERLRPPCWSMNTEVEMAWCQVYWLVEGFWGPDAEDMDVVQHFGSIDDHKQKALDFFRAAYRPKGNCMVVKPSYLTHFKSANPQRNAALQNGVDGVMLLHDAPVVFDQDLVRKLRYLADYDDPEQCLFMGYWQSKPFVTPSATGVAASAYQNVKRKAAAVVFFNHSDADQALGGTLLAPGGLLGSADADPAAAARPMDVARAYDLVSGKDIKLSWRDGRLCLDEAFVVAKHGMRILALEGTP